MKCGTHLKSSTDLTGFPVFPPGTKSLLSKHLTRDVWNKYKDAADEFNYTFKQCIFSGCQNVDSQVGVYAGSLDSYKKFADFFDSMLEECHGHKKGDKHNKSDAASMKPTPMSEGES